MNALPNSAVRTGLKAAPHGSHEPAGFLRRYVFSMDHKIIGIQYLLTAMLIAPVAGSFMDEWLSTWPSV